MGIRHVVMFRWAEGVTAQQIADVERNLAQLPGQIPELRSYQFGADLGINEGNYDFVIVAETDNIEGYVTYRDHPEHQVVKDMIAPLAAERAAIQAPITNP